MKTAMQELIESLKKYDCIYNDEGLKVTIDMAESMLEKEKEQIIEAFWKGDNSDCISEQNSFEFAEEYYNQTYNQNK